MVTAGISRWTSTVNVSTIRSLPSRHEAAMVSSSIQARERAAEGRASAREVAAVTMAERSEAEG